MADRRLLTLRKTIMFYICIWNIFLLFGCAKTEMVSEDNTVTNENIASTTTGTIAIETEAIETEEIKTEEVKTEKSDFAHRIIEYGRRFAILAKGEDPDFLLPVNLLSGRTDYAGYAPRGSIRIKTRKTAQTT